MSAPDATRAERSETPEEPVASRARIQASADEGRRRLQHEIHDGAQQRLVHALVVLKVAGNALDSASPAAALVQEALANVEQATRDLRTVVHAILPRSLTHGGLQTGLQSPVDDLPVQVGLRVSAPRLSPEVETTAYLVVAEAVHAGGALTVTSLVASGTAVRVALPVHPDDEAARQDGVASA